MLEKTAIVFYRIILLLLWMLTAAYFPNIIQNILFCVYQEKEIHKSSSKSKWWEKTIIINQSLHNHVDCWLMPNCVKNMHVKDILN